MVETARQPALVNARRAREPSVPTSEEKHEAFLMLCSAFAGICFAGGIYPFCACVCFLAGSFAVAGFMPQMGLEDVLGIISTVSLFGGFLGVIISSATGLLSLVIVSLFNRTMGGPIPTWSVGICAGSLAGFVPTACFFFADIRFLDFWTFSTSMLLGPGLASMLGIAGAAWQMSAAKYSTFRRGEERKSLQISISHMMAATAWFALLFAISNFFDRVNFAIMVLSWVLLHIALTAMLTIARQLHRTDNH